MANPNGIASGAHISLTESHEDRLQKVESNLQEVSVNIGKIQTHQEYLHEALDIASKSILDKLDTIGSKVGSFESRLAPIEMASQISKTRSENIKAIIKGAIIAASGAVAGALAKLIFDVVN